ncbi:DUF6714 family protein [Leeia aquatica]|uniref:Uncharacterized protein n=1 Tax=Leeia aquatica TaxID=2725557 RepID=A0A847S3A0_9NEIS|nr:DUF6714 family protein [Leeia aquatica]NLR73647.1 hypothetical protein [Leeia aquatica]
MSEPNQLAAVVRQVFHAVPERGEGPTMREADVIRQHGEDSPRRESAKALDNDRRWWQISDASFERYPGIFPWLDDQGFRYYLPAYLTWTLKYPDRAQNSAVTRALVQALLLPVQWDKVDACKKRFALFDLKQAHCIADWLDWRIAEGGPEAEEAQLALERYWQGRR